MPISRNERSNSARNAVAPEGLPSDLHVVDEQRDQRVEIARVDRERVTGGELTDLVACDQIVECGHPIAEATSSVYAAAPSGRRWIASS